jgi:hypothetical protein
MAEKGGASKSKWKSSKKYEKSERTIMEPPALIVEFEKGQLGREEFVRDLLKPLLVSEFKKSQFKIEKCSTAKVLITALKDMIIDSFSEFEKKKYDDLSRIRAQAAIIPGGMYREKVEDEIKEGKTDLYDARTRIMEDGGLTIEEIFVLLNTIDKKVDSLNEKVKQYKNFK